MERRSDKHTPRVDDEMRHETDSLVRGSPIEARTEEFREQEGAAEDEPDAGPVVTHPDRPAGPGTPAEAMTDEEANQRAELARHLPPSCFPARPAELVRAAAEAGATDRQLALLESLPDWLYESMAQVWHALGGSVEHRPS